MLYIVKRVTNLDRGADDGSLSIIFESYFGKRYCLVFSGRRSGRDEPTPNAVHAVFPPPTLDIYSAVKHKMPETGDVSLEWQKESKSVSWRDARKILRTLKRHMIGMEAEKQGIYEAMLHASKNDGRA
jgi:hypothetical protein